MPAPRFARPRNTSENSAQAFPMAPVISPQPKARCRALEIEAARRFRGVETTGQSSGIQQSKFFLCCCCRSTRQHMPLSFPLPTDSPTTTDETNQLNQRIELFAKCAAVPNTRDQN